MENIVEQIQQNRNEYLELYNKLANNEITAAEFKIRTKAIDKEFTEIKKSIKEVKKVLSEIIKKAKEASAKANK